MLFTELKVMQWIGFHGDAGIQLRKVEERAQKHRPPAHLDVQSLMEAAFELRRKALEDNDSDFDDSDGRDGLSASWSDVD